MVLNVHQQKQEAKYSVPYHYLATERTVSGVLYLSYLRRARAFLLERSPSRAIDCGCGDGRFIAFVREQEPQCPIEGTDYSETAIGFARLFNPGVTFQVGDLMKALPYPDASFDVLSLIEVVEHFEPDVLPRVLRECRRILRPGGAIIITTPTTNEKKMSKAHFQHFTEASMTKYLQETGYRVQTMEGNFTVSPLQKLAQGFMENRFFAVRLPSFLDWYARQFRQKWDRCSVKEGRRMIVVGEAV